jgi:superfamily I DNA/RNA helicase
LIKDIARKLKEYKEENNIMLLADAPKFLHGLIQESDTPFIYEKVGSFYRNYLIDEFQDTSGFQWRNFLPLLTNSLDQGYSSLVVGDVKQAIYRWRGGDLKLLQERVERDIGTHRVGTEELSKNYRSSQQVVAFNNQLFHSASSVVAQKIGAPLAPEVYRDIRQGVVKSDDGLVSILFLKDEEERGWKEQALDLVPRWMEQLQQSGVPLKDIAILVRRNSEGQEIASQLLQYKHSPDAKENCRYDVVSNESLRVDGAASVRLLHAAMQYLFNTDDAIARAQLGYEFAQLHEPDRSLKDVFAVTNQIIFENNLPPAFTRDKLFLRKLPLFELTETLIEIFRLGEYTGELIYLQTFQDLVLKFYTRARNDLGAFLEWWADHKSAESIKVSGEVDAAQIITIHQSKGLQFPYVIIPFCNWHLDHDGKKAPNLWVRSDDPLFKDAGYIPVRYSSTLKNTFFEPFYTEEQSKVYLDNLNVLYVAFTRAERGLMVAAPQPKTQTMDNVGALVYFSIKTDQELMPQWNEGLQEWKSGSLVTSAGKLENESPSVSLHSYPVFRWRDKLVIRQSGSSYFSNALQEEHRESIAFGIQMHAVLSRIKYRDEISDSLDQIVREGLITDAERVDVGQQLDELLNDEKVASWYSKAWEVRTEVPILLPAGSENRIDRLMMRESDSGKQAIVVDFKTGVKTEKDKRQVLDYMTILRSMNFTSVEGYLVYLNDREVVEVKAGGKQKVVKKKSDNQLGFDF